MTARRTPANRKAAPTIKMSGELVEVPSEALANEAAAAESIAQDVEAPADEVADAIAELEAEANGTRKAPAKKEPAKVAAAKKASAPTAHTDCTHAKSGAEGKKARAACRREKAAEAAKAAKA